MRKNAFIDMGTNSFKLQFAASPEDFGEGLAMARTVRLGEGSRGRLSGEAIARAWGALREFDGEIRRREAENVYFFATAATREADNGREFVRSIEERLGWRGEILTGEQEAALGFAGAGLSAGGALTLIDLGGGSTEITAGRARPDISVSFPVGALKQTNAPRNLAEVFSALPPKRGKLIGIGGTARIVASIREKARVYSRAALHGAVMKREWLEDLSRQVERMSLEEKRALCAMDPERASILAGGLQILCFLLREYDAGELTFSDYGIIEGYALKIWGEK